MCYKSVNPECNYGILAPSLLPPHAVSNNCHSVALETLIGSQPRRRETASRMYLNHSTNQTYIFEMCTFHGKQFIF